MCKIVGSPTDRMMKKKEICNELAREMQIIRDIYEASVYKIAGSSKDDCKKFDTEIRMSKKYIF